MKDKRDDKYKRVDADKERKVPAKKDRKRWCGGHEGREHQPKCYNYAELKHDMFAAWSYGKSWRVLACKVCGRQLAIYMPSDSLPPSSTRNIKPDWVDK